ncbi:TetR/AcrR family transcriptional regulator [Mycobacterium intracellulare]|uniref:TetR family transcriptional regulator n=2 Tax=Mycobacterium intracellulare subsp. chimaera TaxID=222805 RepID=A0ABT7P8Q7_MYCIT|nr:TetR/AcrR family transcriptional regulator [Mycobacterium intracellulare]AOS93557.1 TetR family transcriptional regulator [Mycobacterium intracellulare subsp. chimaera]ARV84000.1 TetR family transcriptional regulator [Mycobacterium intracellulare subsp. chimaera]ASQ88138.1 TetR family transcriptional regulator [Mycobacterium intracellulare subsp. chimaera]KPN45613.1 TetR family transcriptional regulator [Mycobacterium intracellulare subsp. chimaera]KPN52117.1 TetR family transcriptional reg
MTTMSARGRGKPPTGRAEVAAAILEAATELFAERGPAATSIRDIAARSNVNHGLVFRHFGTKEQLVGAVLDHLGDDLSAQLETDTPAEVVQRSLDRQMRVMARTVLDGYPAGQLQKRFPNIATLLDGVRPLYDDEVKARLAVANALALQFGWRLFAPVLRSATGIEELTDAELRAAVGAEVERMLGPPDAQ